MLQVRIRRLELRMWSGSNAFCFIPRCSFLDKNRLQFSRRHQTFIVRSAWCVGNVIQFQRNSLYIPLITSATFTEYTGQSAKEIQTDVGKTTKTDIIRKTKLLGQVESRLTYTAHHTGNIFLQQTKHASNHHKN
jgi:hypothetical protein